jgi:hypothetical protein
MKCALKICNNCGRVLVNGACPANACNPRKTNKQIVEKFKTLIKQLISHQVALRRAEIELCDSIDTLTALERKIALQVDMDINIEADKRVRAWVHENGKSVDFTSLRNVNEALVEQNLELARKSTVKDNEIRNLEYEIDQMSLGLYKKGRDD